MSAYPTAIHALRSGTAGMALALVLASAATALPAQAQEAAMTAHPNSIQPETTLSLTASGEVMREPDIAFISSGVTTEAATAGEAMETNRARMNGVMEALKKAGIAERNIQTSNFSLQPRYEYEKKDNRNNKRILVGYQVSNQVTAKVTELDRLGATLDGLVEAGGNTFSGLRFALEDDSEARNEARRLAVLEAMSRAEIYAETAGYEIARIVTINEYESQGGPRPQAMMARSADLAESAPTPISGGEVGYSVQVNVTFELVK
jgi:uncharacterized protein